MHCVLERDIYVIAAARTPIGARDGILKDYSATDLGAVAIGAALERAGVAGSDVDEVFLGNVVSAGLGMAFGKKASVGGGIPQDVPVTVVNSVCSSGVSAVWDGVKSMLAGTAGVVVAGGMESRTNAPYLLTPHTPDGKRLRATLDGETLTLRTREDDPESFIKVVRQLHEAGLRDANIRDGLTCPFSPGTLQNDYAIGYAEAHGFDVAEIDECAYQSYRKAHEAWESGKFDAEVVPVGEAARDELVPQSRWEGLRGTSTSPSSAYNTGGLGDAAAALVLATAERARALGLKPLARVMGFSRHECGPADFVEAPVHAVKRLADALTNAGRPSDFPIIEANESFGLQLVLFGRAWPRSAINVHGGTVALRHPLGAAGARILTTLVHAMRRYEHPRGLGVICFGGGGAFAVALERA